MKTLIINGSPRKKGDTARLLAELRGRLDGEVIQIDAYDAGISPCVDCRACQRKPGCVIRDDMDIIYGDDFDSVVIASPIYMSSLTGPMVSLASRFQAYYCAKRFLNISPERRPKKGAVILVGGGDGSNKCALDMAKLMLRYMHARLAEESIIMSMDTDNLPAGEDAAALSAVGKLAERLNAPL